MNDILKDWSTLVLIWLIKSFPFLVVGFFAVLALTKIITINGGDFMSIYVVVRF